MSQSATGLIKHLQDHNLRIFTTADMLTLTGLSRPAASQALLRLARKGLLTRLRRGVWANSFSGKVDSWEAVPHLMAPWPGYVSLYSALSFHGVVEEVPQMVYGVTAGRSQKIKTSLGHYHFHHLPTRLMWGYVLEHHGGSSIPVAEKEKAFLDLAYLGLIPRSPLGMPYQRDGKWDLDFKKLTRYARRFAFPPLSRYVSSLLSR